MTSPNVLACIVAFNGLPHTINAVESLRQQTMPVKICVWDNNSTDGTRDWLLQQDDVSCVLSERNVFWSPALNGLVEQCHEGEGFLLFMNNDITLPPHGVADMVEVAQRPRVGIVGPVVPMLGGPQDPLVALKDRDTSPQRVVFVLGACTLMRYGVWQKVGKLDEDMALGADDHNYCIRLKDYDYHIYVVRSVHAGHVGHASSHHPDGAKAWDAEGGKSWGHYDRKHAGYFATEKEAIDAHFGQALNIECTKGTGWSLDQRKFFHRQYGADVTDLK